MFIYAFGKAAASLTHPQYLNVAITGMIIFMGLAALFI